MTTPTLPRQIRDAIKSFVPIWLSNRLGLNAGFRVLYAIALIADLLIEQLFQGTLAPFPGLGTKTALPLIGQSRGIIRGLVETDTAYALRLQGWLDLWGNAGAAEELVLLIQNYLGGMLRVRVIDRSGNFVTAETSGGTPTVGFDATWNWDGELAATRSGWWGDTWIVVYTTDLRYPVYTNFADPAWLAAWGQYQGFGLGMQVPRNVVDGVYSIVGDFKGAHTWLQSIIWTPDSSLFNPGSLGGIPDGTWANYSHQDISTNQVITRILSHGGSYVRYWDPYQGG